ncbi:ankyrin repeat domain-containing protein [Hydrogenophaga sp.]|uniref:ankyrin repeat domain-containing protein n=1 Tax=Hydrogenophaga sp. TaxID=1904254 RepID=UPI00345B858C
MLLLLEQGTGVALNYETPLHWACANGRVDCVRALLDRGADVNAKDYSGTPLHWAAGETTIDCMHLKRPSGQGTVHDCHVTGKAECVRLLLAHGADPNA